MELNLNLTQRITTRCLIRALVLWWITASGLSSIDAADNQLLLRDVCRLKGQEENTLQGYGLVVGLKGTGDDASKPTAVALATAMQRMGGQIGTDASGQLNLSDVEKAGNAALVFIQATIPPQGAQQGDQLECTISAIFAKSLEGGTLVLSPVLGPNAGQQAVYGLAQGKLTIPDPRVPTTASIYRGCKMEATVQNQFVKDDKITLVLDKDVSSFNTAQYIEDLINELNNTGLTGGANIPPEQAVQTSNFQLLAKARDPVHIEVTIPSYYRDRPVAFVAFLMEMPLPNIQNKKRVVINEREGVIIIGEDVMISPVAINHKNLSIEARAGQKSFVGMDIENPQPRPKLKNLVDALNALNVPSQDVIAIIKALKQKGDLFGELVIQ
ncbi:MAG: flagellar basal body P-ring protein FlgI [Pirellulaceae bacterium]|nr:flagellar basal body P-ring protein FlgI [Pirellulaceae bacterium]